jgi:hypothetical protein
MLKKFALIAATCLSLAACASDAPRVVQASADAKEIHLTGGMATQIEMPSGWRVQSVVVGNPTLVSADRAEGVVNLVPKDGVSGDTNLIVRATEDGSEVKVYQYKLTILAR